MFDFTCLDLHNRASFKLIRVLASSVLILTFCLYADKTFGWCKVVSDLCVFGRNPKVWVTIEMKVTKQHLQYNKDGKPTAQNLKFFWMVQLFVKTPCYLLWGNLLQICFSENLSGEFYIYIYQSKQSPFV